MWFRSSGMAEGIGALEQAKGAFTVRMKLGTFLEWAKQYLSEMGPEITPDAFQEAMLRALDRVGLLRQ